jgi:hypothetical protein
MAAVSAPIERPAWRISPGVSLSLGTGAGMAIGVRQLRADPVELQGREHADHRPGDALAHFGEGLVLRHRGIQQAVGAARDSLKLACLVELDQKLRRRAELTHVGGAQEPSTVRELENTPRALDDHTVSFSHYLCTSRVNMKHVPLAVRASK